MDWVSGMLGGSGVSPATYHDIRHSPNHPAPPPGPPPARKNSRASGSKGGGKDLRRNFSLGVHGISKREAAGGVRIGLGCQTFQDTLLKNNLTGY